MLYREIFFGQGTFENHLWHRGQQNSIGWSQNRYIFMWIQINEYDMFNISVLIYSISMTTLFSDVPVTLTAIVQQQSNDLFCRRCSFNPVSVVFLPCGHLCTCTDCAPSIKHCILCKQLVKGTVRTYMM